MSRIAPLEPPYDVDIKAQFDRIMRGAAPLMLFRGWARTKEAAAVSAPFILVNSAAGLAGYFGSGRPVPPFAWWLAIVAALAGLAGSHLGSRRIPIRGIQWLLAAVLVIAGGKLLAGG